MRACKQAVKDFRSVALALSVSRRMERCACAASLSRHTYHLEQM